MDKQWGFEKSTVQVEGKRYLTRWILYIAGRTLRLHKFHRGDDDRAFHDHPWKFWTFPLSTYFEKVPSAREYKLVEVKRFRWHHRPAKYQHIVIGAGKPFYTIVVTGKRERLWGFWPTRFHFVPYTEWK